MDAVNYITYTEYLRLGELKVGKLEIKFCFPSDTCIQPHTFAHNLHFKATKKIVFQLHYSITNHV
jgi:hypothetical protein